MPAAAARGCVHHRLLALLLLVLLHLQCAAAWTVPSLPQPTKRLSSSRRLTSMSSSTKGVLFVCLGNICRWVLDAACPFDQDAHSTNAPS